MPEREAHDGGHEEDEHPALGGGGGGCGGDELGEGHGEDDEGGEDVEWVGGGEVGEPEPVGVVKLGNVAEDFDEGEEERHGDEGG